VSLSETAAPRKKPREAPLDDQGDPFKDRRGLRSSRLTADLPPRPDAPVGPLLGLHSVVAKAKTQGYTPINLLTFPFLLPLMSEVTRILSAIEHGDANAAEKLLPLVYDELRKLAAQKLAKEKPGQTLQATALVHEAYLRLVDGEKLQHWNSRGHFFAACAEAMRRILVDQARRRQSLRRGANLRRQPIEDLEIEAPEPSLDVLSVNEALDRFQGVDATAAQIVKLRYFVGLTIPQVAEALGISTSTADRSWAYARAWLHTALKQGADHGAPE
jgi:RNA polymerase sigma factor (TIGR02999 family)